MKNILGYIPWVVVGRIIGTLFIIPFIYFLIDKFKYTNKYNDDAELYFEIYTENSEEIKVVMPASSKSQFYLKNVDDKIKVRERFELKAGENYFSSPFGHYVPFYSTEYEKCFSIMYFNYFIAYGFYGGKEVILTVNKDDMQNTEYGTKENPVPVLKMIGVNNSIRDGNKDFDKEYMDEFYYNNVTRYLKYKMSKKEFESRFKNE